MNNLKYLDLSYNKIGYVGMKTFAKAEGALNNLENLDLTYNNFAGDEGMRRHLQRPYLSKGTRAPTPSKLPTPPSSIQPHPSSNPTFRFCY